MTKGKNSLQHRRTYTPQPWANKIETEHTQGFLRWNRNEPVVYLQGEIRRGKGDQESPLDFYIDGKVGYKKAAVNDVAGEPSYGVSLAIDSKLVGSVKVILAENERETVETLMGSRDSATVLISGTVISNAPESTFHLVVATVSRASM